MFSFINGNILTRNTDPHIQTVVCHQVNCRGVMGSGLAKQVREQIPTAFNQYKALCNTHTLPLLGTIQAIDAIRTHGFVLVNCFGQDGYGRDKQYTDYEALRSCLMAVRKQFPNAVIRIPFGMGCGLGGGDWMKVLGIISNTVGDMPVEIWRLPASGGKP